MDGENELDLSATADQLGEELFGEGGELAPEAERDDDVKLLEAPAAKPPIEEAKIISETLDPNAPPTPPAPEDPLAKPPKTWKAEEAVGWETLTPAQRAAVHRREEDFYKGIEGYKERAGRGDAFEQMMTPFMPALKHYGFTPEQVLPGLMHTHMTLSLGRPEEKAALVKRLIADYRIDPAALGLGTPAEAPFVDPAVQDLQAKFEQLQSERQRETQAASAAKQQAVLDEITAFQKDPANAHFDEVADDMTLLIRGSGGKMSLKDAYERAVWANPVTRLKAQEATTAAAAAKARKEAEEAAAKAKADAAKNVKTSHKRVGQTASAGSMDETIDAAYEKIVGRSH